MQCGPFPLQFLGQGQCAWKWAAVDGLLCRAHCGRIYSSEWITVGCSAYSHWEFNLSTLKAHLSKPSFANLLWLRSGLPCRLKKMYKCCKFNVTHETLRIPPLPFMDFLIWHLKSNEYPPSSFMRNLNTHLKHFDLCRNSLRDQL